MTIPAIIAFGLGAWAGVTQGPRFFGDDDTATAGPSLTPERQAQGAGPSPTPDSKTSAPAAATALSVDKAVAQSPGCSLEGYAGSHHEWEEATASIAQQAFRSAMICALGDKDQTASIDYVVPNGAATLTATVGQDDSSGGTGKTVRFTVLDVTTDQPLASVDARYGEALEVSAPVENLVRVRLEVIVIESSDASQYDTGDTDHLTTAAWAVPAFS